jgi:hypothetical protein
MRVRWTVSAMLVALVAFAAGYFRHDLANEALAGSQGTPAPLKPEPGNSPGRPNNAGAIALAALPEKPGEWQTAFARGTPDWEREVRMARALKKCGAAEFQELAQGRGPLCEQLKSDRSRSQLETGPEFRTIFLGAIVDRWLEVDREGALASLAQAASGERFPVLAALDSELAGRLGPEVLEAAASAEAPGWALKLIHDAIRGLATRDLPAARAWMQRLPGKLQTPDLKQAFQEGFAAADPEGSMDSGQNDKKARNIAIRAARERGVEVLRRVTEKTGYDLVAMGLLKRDAPRAAAELCAQALSSGQGGDTTELVLASASFAEEDPAAARLWVESLPEKIRARAAKGLVRGWAFHDPRAALDWAAQQPEDAAGYALQLEAFNSWSAMDWKAAREWAASQSGSLRDRLNAASVNLLASNRGPDEAAELARTLPSEQFPDIIGRVSMELTRKQPEKAAQWVAELPRGYVREEALEGVLKSWSLQDAKAALSWAQNLPAGALRDEAQVALLSQTSHFFADADRILATIEDPWMKAEGARRHFERWRVYDAPAARRWLEELPGADPEFRRDVLEGYHRE